MGMDPATLAALGFGVDAISNIWGAVSGNSTNAANTNAQIAHSNMVQQYVNQAYQPGMNPFAQAMMSFVGRGVPGTFPGMPQVGGQTFPQPAGTGGTGTGGGNGSPGAPDGPINGDTGGNHSPTDGANTSFNPGNASSLLAMMPSYASAPAAPSYTQDGVNSVIAAINHAQAVGLPPGTVTSEIEQAVRANPGAVYGIPTSILGQLTQNLSNMGLYDQNIAAQAANNPASVNAANGPAGGQAPVPTLDPNRKMWSTSDPRTQAEILQQDYKGDTNAFLAASPSAGIAQQALLAQQLQAQFPGTQLQYGQDGSVMDAKTGRTLLGPNSQYASVMQAPLQHPQTNPLAGTGGVNGVGGNGQPIAGSVERYLINGKYYDKAGNLIPGGDPGATPDAPGTPQIPANLPVPNFGGGDPSGAGYGASPTSNAYIYQPHAAYQANTMLPGQAPMIGALPQINPQQINPLNISGIPQVAAPNQSASMAQLPGAFNAPQISGMPGINAQQVGAPTGTQGFNAGQDGLLQMMRSDLTPKSDPSLDLNLQSLASGDSQFDNTDLFKALGTQDQFAMDKQVGQLHASAGSLGARFGTAMNQNEGLLRSQMQSAADTRNAQIAQQSFEAAQGRRMSTLGLMSQNDQNANQFTLANQGLKLQAGTAAANNGLQGAGLDLQAGLANAGNNLQAQQFNATQGQNAQLANQQAGMTAGLANQQQAGQFSLANANADNSMRSLMAQLGLTAGQSNQSAAMQGALANQQAGMTAQGQNAANSLNAQQSNLQALLQSAMANQNASAQFQLNNANTYNQGQQFNVAQQTGQDQFNAAQGNTYNSMIMQALMSAANAQQGQQGSNNALIGILNGVGVPQSMPNALPGALGDAGSSMAMLPMLLQMLGGKSGGGSSWAPMGYSNAPIGGFTPSPFTFNG